MAYQIYLAGVLFPVAPAKLKMKINGQNKTMNLINGQEINVLNPAGLTEMDFDLLLPSVEYPFADYEDGFETPEYFLEELEQIMISRRPVRFMLIRESPSGDSFFDTNMSVSLEDYSISEDAKDGTDITVSISLKQYVHYGVQKIIIKEPEATSETAEVEVETDRETSGAPEVKTYTVQSNDTLWNIAKKCLGNGGRWPEIHELNRDKISNPNQITPGMVLSMPG